MNLKFTKVLYNQDIKDTGETQGLEFIYLLFVNKCQNFTNAPEEYWNPLFVPQILVLPLALQKLNKGEKLVNWSG
jgi:hypothetical protein